MVNTWTGVAFLLVFCFCTTAEAAPTCCGRDGSSDVNRSLMDVTMRAFGNVQQQMNDFFASMNRNTMMQSANSQSSGAERRMYQQQYGWLSCLSADIINSVHVLFEITNQLTLAADRSRTMAESRMNSRSSSSNWESSEMRSSSVGSRMGAVSASSSASSSGTAPCSAPSSMGAPVFNFGC